MGAPLGKKPISYTEEQKTTFIETAQELGIYQAQKELGYPSYKMARTWFDQRGLDYPQSVVQTLAAMTKSAYKTEELIQVGYVIIEGVLEGQLKPDITEVERKALADTYNKAINSILLLQGKANSITEKVDKFTDSYQTLIDEMNAANAAKESSTNK